MDRTDYVLREGGPSIIGSVLTDITPSNEAGNGWTQVMSFKYYKKTLVSKEYVLEKNGWNLC